MKQYKTIVNELEKHFSDIKTHDFVFVEETDRINVDKLIAFKEISRLGCQYILQASVSVHPEHLVPFFSLSLIEKDLDGNHEDSQSLLECDLSHKDLLTMAYNSVKNTSVLFDTKNYCNNLVRFLKEFKILDSDFYKPSMKTIS